MSHLALSCLDHAKTLLDRVKQESSTRTHTLSLTLSHSLSKHTHDHHTTHTMRRGARLLSPVRLAQQPHDRLVVRLTEVHVKATDGVKRIRCRQHDHVIGRPALAQLCVLAINTNENRNNASRITTSLVFQLETTQYKHGKMNCK